MRKIIKFLLCLMLATVAFAMVACEEEAPPKTYYPNHSSNTSQKESSEESSTEREEQEEEEEEESYTTVDVVFVDVQESLITLDEGQSYTLTATVFPSNATDKTVKWESMNPDVATVSNGYVLAKKAGTTKIWATSNNGKRDDCTVTVREKVVEVESISLNASTLSLEEGESFTLTATVYPSNATDKTIQWDSADTGIATVSGGNVTATGVGTTTITAKTANGKRVFCAVSVSAKTIAIISVSLSESTVELEEGESITLTATLEPSNATDKTLKWNSTNESVATVIDGKITALSVGTAVITATAHNGLYADCCVTVTSPFVFEEYGDGYALVDYVGEKTEVVVPSTYQGKKVVAIGTGKIVNFQYVVDGFNECSTLKKVTLPNTLETINHGAFLRCTSLTEVEMPSCKSIGFCAFQSCTSLKTVALPKNLEYLGDSVFIYCSALTNITIPDKVTNKSNNLFKDCTSLSEVKIGSGITSIGTYAFQNCTSLQSITIPETVTTIGDYAFENCSALKSVSIPESVTSLGSGCFVDCTSLQTIEIKNKNITLGSGILGGVELPINCELPETPLTINGWSTGVVFKHSSADITGVSLTLGRTFSKSTYVTLKISGTKTYDWYGSSNPHKISFKLYNGNTVLQSGTLTSVSVAAGESFTVEGELRLELTLLEVLNLQELRLVLSDVSW